ncbi:MAG: hypothetical protein AAF138_05265 [Planctomycetota bacterium]
MTQAATSSATDVLAGRAPAGSTFGVMLPLCATLWAASLAVLGSWFWLEGPSAWPVAAELCRVAGWTISAAGQLVFLCLVADRLFPNAPRRVVLAIEGVTALAVVIGMIWLLVAAAELAIGALP